MNQVIKRVFLQATSVCMGTLFMLPALANQTQSQNEQQPPLQLSLEQVYQFTLQNDPEWAAVKNRNKSAGYTAEITKSALRPDISITGNATWSEVEPDSVQDYDQDTESVTASITQPLLDFSSYRKYKQGESQTIQFEKEFELAKQDLILRVLNAYIDTLKSKAVLDAKKTETEAFEKQYLQTEAREKVGVANKVDLLDVKAAFDISTAEQISAQTAYETSIRQLQIITNQSIKSIYDFSDKLPIEPPTPNVLDKWLELSMVQNKNLQAQQAKLNSEELNYKSSEADLYPTLELVGSYQKNWSEVDPNVIPSGGTDSDITAIAVNLEIPLYFGGQVRAAKKQNYYNYLSQQDNMLLTSRSVEQNTVTNFQTMVDSVSEVKSRNQAVNSSKESVKATQNEYENGTRDLVDVLNAQRNLYNSIRDYQISRYDHVLYEANLMAISGQLTAEFINELNIYLKK